MSNLITGPNHHSCIWKLADDEEREGSLNHFFVISTALVADKLWKSTLYERSRRFCVLIISSFRQRNFIWHHFDRSWKHETCFFKSSFPTFLRSSSKKLHSKIHHEIGIPHEHVDQTLACCADVCYNCLLQLQNINVHTIIGVQEGFPEAGRVSSVDFGHLETSFVVAGLAMVKYIFFGQIKNK